MSHIFEKNFLNQWCSIEYIYYFLPSNLKYFSFESIFLVKMCFFIIKILICGSKTFVYWKKKITLFQKVRSFIQITSFNVTICHILYSKLLLFLAKMQNSPGRMWTNDCAAVCWWTVKWAGSTMSAISPIHYASSHFKLDIHKCTLIYIHVVILYTYVCT